MAEKRYFWLKLFDDFFTSKRIKKLRNLAGGDTYTIIYLKMQLKALKDEGYLYFDGVMDDFAEELALDIDEKAEYDKRVNELKRLISEQPHRYPVEFSEVLHELRILRALPDLRQQGPRQRRVVRPLVCSDDLNLHAAAPPFLPAAAVLPPD